jgi:hypothetical protein
MEVKRSAIEEISRLRLYQSCIDSCKKWAYGSAAITVSMYFAPLADEYEPHKKIVQLIFLLIALASAGFVYFSGKPRTVLSKKQMKLLGLSEDDIAHQAKELLATSEVKDSERYAFSGTLSQFMFDTVS